LEIAGIQMGIEVPENFDWDWPESSVAEFVCLPREPEVHIGLRIAEFSSRDLGGERYSLGPWVFEVASYGDDWLLGLSRRGVREQLARFDREFRNGEVLISKEAAMERRFPLRTPLDEWIVLHRTVARGGLVLNGSASFSEGGASICLGSDDSQTRPQNGWATHRMALLGRNTVLLREEGGLLRSFNTPWSEVSDSRLGDAASVSELIVREESDRPFRECIDPDEAAELLVAHAVVPLCDEVLFDRVLRNARRLSEQTKVFRIGEIPETPAPIAWRSAQLQNAFAPPSAGF